MIKTMADMYCGLGKLTQPGQCVSAKQLSVKGEKAGGGGGGSCVQDGKLCPETLRLMQKAVWWKDRATL